jgi:hypothetical protein
MRLRIGAILALAFAAAFASAALAAPLAAPTSVATKMQLRGHLPDLGEVPAMWVFTTAASYDAFRVKFDVADVFPDASSLYMSFDKELLALYTRGDDSGGRCLRAGPSSSVTATAVTLDLSWDTSSCGAPATAHYPFVLTSLARVADDGSSWIVGRQVCGAAPGVDGSTACATGSGASATPLPSVTPTATPTTATPTLTPSPTTSPTTPPPSPSPSATRTAIPSPTRTIPPTPSQTAVVAGSSSAGDNGLLDIAGWLAVGLIVGVFVTALVMRPRVYRV